MTSITALIAEDEPLLAAALRAELARAWPELRIAAQVGDGASAVRQALALRPQVLFLDIRMPGMTGLEAAAELAEEWPDDPYRAVEVGGDGPIDVRADLYSWGRIFVHAATGRLPERGKDQLTAGQIPDAVRQVVLECVALPRSKRPDNMNTVLAALKARS